MTVGTYTMICLHPHHKHTRARNSLLDNATNFLSATVSIELATATITIALFIK